MEMTSGNHLWAMCAESVSDVAPETHLQSFPSIESATLCLFRPCETSLLRAKCVSLLWVPNSSLTVSQREIHPFEHLRRSDARTDLRRTTPSSSDPLMHVQIL